MHFSDRLSILSSMFMFIIDFVPSVLHYDLFSFTIAVRLNVLKPRSRASRFHQFVMLLLRLCFLQITENVERICKFRLICPTSDGRLRLRRAYIDYENNCGGRQLREQSTSKFQRQADRILCPSNGN